MPSMVHFHSDKTGNSSCRRPGILSVADHLLDNATEITLTGGVATGASVSISGNVLVVSNIAAGQGPCSEIRISGVRVDGIGQGSGSSAQVFFSAGGGNTIVSGQTVATVISAFSEPKTLGDVGLELIPASTGGTGSVIFEVREGFPNAWTSPIQEALGGGDNGSELDFFIQGVPDQGALEVSLTSGTVISGTVTADDGDLASPVDLCASGCAMTNTAVLIGDGTDLEFTIQFNQSGVGGEDPNPGNGEELVFRFSLDVSASTGISLPLNPGAIRASVTMAPGSDTVEPYFVEDFMPPGGALIFTIVDLLWTFSTGGAVSSSPAVGGDGTIYVGSDDSNLYAVNPDGSQRWAFPTGGSVQSSPALGADGTVYVGSDDFNLYAVNPDGTQQWTFPTANFARSSPAIGADGTIYVGSDDSNLYAVNPDGSQSWAFPTGGSVQSSPALGADGTVYVGSDDFNLYAVNPDGSQKWSFPTGDKISSSPAIGVDGSIYVGSWDNNLYAINPDGTQQWAFSTGDDVLSSPSVGPDGAIYVGSNDTNLYATNPDGSSRWTFPTGGLFASAPAIASDGSIYVGTSDTNLYAINSNGTQRWVVPTQGGVVSSPAIAADGTVYAGSNDSDLYAINSQTGGLADSAWPMFHRDVRHTGQADPGCKIELELTYTSGTLDLDFNLITGIPAAWNVWFSVQNLTLHLWSVPVPVVGLQIPVPIPEFPQLGTIGFLTTMTTLDGGILCSNWETIDTGTPAAMPAARELKGLFGKSAP